MRSPDMHSALRSAVRVTGAACAVWLAGLGCVGGDEGEASVPSVEGVRTAVVTQQPFSETVGAIGVVTPRAGHIAAVSAPAAARVQRVFVAVGQNVAAGEQLVELDQTPFVGATRAADATLAAAEQSFERARRLVEQGISPRKDLDQARADLERARADAATARRQLELSVVRTPISGVVTKVGATLGATADPSVVLVEVDNIAALDILFTVTPTLAGRVRRGAKVTISAGQHAAGEPLGVGTVADVSGIVDSTTRGVIIRAEVPTTRRPMRIGETVYGEIIAVVYAKAIVVPIEALVPDGEEFKVFVVDATGMAHGRTVEVGGRTERLAQILRGLAVGERIVTYGAYGIEDSAKVVPIAPPSAKP